MPTNLQDFDYTINTATAQQTGQALTVNDVIANRNFQEEVKQHYRDFTDSYRTEYYTGNHVSLFMGPIYLTDVVHVEWQSMSNITPLYAYNSLRWDTLLKGNYNLVGSFAIYDRETDYIYKAYNQYKELAGDSNVAIRNLTDVLASQRNKLMQQLLYYQTKKAYKFNEYGQPVDETGTVVDLEKVYGNATIETINTFIDNLIDRRYLETELNTGLFDLGIVFGNYTVEAPVVKSFTNVKIINVSQSITIDDNIIIKKFDFIAREQSLPPKSVPLSLPSASDRPVNKEEVFNAIEKSIRHSVRNSDPRPRIYTGGYDLTVNNRLSSEDHIAIFGMPNPGSGYFGYKVNVAEYWWELYYDKLVSLEAISADADTMFTENTLTTDDTDAATETQTDDNRDSGGTSTTGSSENDIGTDGVDTAESETTATLDDITNGVAFGDAATTATGTLSDLTNRTVIRLNNINDPTDEALSNLSDSSYDPTQSSRTGVKVIYSDQYTLTIDDTNIVAPKDVSYIIDTYTLTEVPNTIGATEDPILIAPWSVNAGFVVDTITRSSTVFQLEQYIVDAINNSDDYSEILSNNLDIIGTPSILYTEIVGDYNTVSQNRDSLMESTYDSMRSFYLSSFSNKLKLTLTFDVIFHLEDGSSITQGITYNTTLVTPSSNDPIVSGISSDQITISYPSASDIDEGNIDIPVSYKVDGNVIYIGIEDSSNSVIYDLGDEDNLDADLSNDVTQTCISRIRGISLSAVQALVSNGIVTGVDSTMEVTEVIPYGVDTTTEPNVTKVYSSPAALPVDEVALNLQIIASNLEVYNRRRDLIEVQTLRDFSLIYNRGEFSDLTSYNTTISTDTTPTYTSYVGDDVLKIYVTYTPEVRIGTAVHGYDAIEIFVPNENKITVIPATYTVASLGGDTSDIQRNIKTYGAADYPENSSAVMRSVMDPESSYVYRDATSTNYFYYTSGGTTVLYINYNAIIMIPETAITSSHVRMYMDTAIEAIYTSLSDVRGDDGLNLDLYAFKSACLETLSEQVYAIINSGDSFGHIYQSNGSGFFTDNNIEFYIDTHVCRDRAMLLSVPILAIGDHYNRDISDPGLNFMRIHVDDDTDENKDTVSELLLNALTAFDSDIDIDISMVSQELEYTSHLQDNLYILSNYSSGSIHNKMYKLSAPRDADGNPHFMVYGIAI